MPIYKIMETAGVYTAGDEIDIVDPELYAIVSRTVPLQPVDPIAVDIEAALYGAAGIPAFPAAAAAANGISIAEVLRYIQENQLGKIDETATLGLLGVNNSLAYRIHELERHSHGWDRWMCAAAVPNGEVHVADRIGATASSTSPFTITSGNNTWGAWTQLLGSEDTPVTAGNVKFDFHKLIVLVANQVSPYFLQVGFGATGAAAVTADTLSSIVINPASNTDKTVVEELMTRRQSAGTKAWARCWCIGANAKTLTIMFGMHEYEG